MISRYGLLLGMLCAVAAAPAVIAPVAFSRLLQPLTVFHPEWVGGRIEKLTDVLSRFRERPGAIATCFIVAVLVQGSMIIYYLAVIYALHLPVGASTFTIKQSGGHALTRGSDAGKLRMQGAASNAVSFSASFSVS